jgi:hypothetical protein
MIRLQWRLNTAIGTPSLVALDQGKPLRGCEAAGRAYLTRSAPSRDREPCLRMLLSVSPMAFPDLVPMALLVRLIPCQTSGRIVRAPAPHRLLRALEMTLPGAFDVVALVCTSLLWVGIRHACLVSKSRRRCKGTQT